MGVRLDHVVIAVPSPGEAAARWTSAGVTATLGGRHPGGTENALVRGPQAAYVELIAVGPDASGPWADRVRGRHGPLGWAVAVDDLDAARSALEAAGFTPGEPYAGARDTADGRHLSWRLCEVGSRAFDPDLPFLIEWGDGMPPGPADGPALTSVVVTPSDPARVAVLLRAVGMSESAVFPGEVFGDPGECVVTLQSGPGGFAGIVLDVAEGVVDPLRPTHTELDGVDILLVAGRRAARGWPVLQRVETVFADLPHPQPWPDPWPDLTPADDAYGRCLDPARYRILSVRADAWVTALTELGVGTASVQDVDAVPHVGPAWSSVVRVDPARADAVPLWICRRGFDGPDDNIVAVAAGGSRPVVLAVKPECGCDACDDGSTAYLEQLDAAVLAVLEGGVLAASDGATEVTRTLDGWSGSGPGLARGDLEGWLQSALAASAGYDVVSGEAWL